MLVNFYRNRDNGSHRAIVSTWTLITSLNKFRPRSLIFKILQCRNRPCLDGSKINFIISDRVYLYGTLCWKLSVDSLFILQQVSVLVLIATWPFPPRRDIHLSERGLQRIPISRRSRCSEKSRLFQLCLTTEKP